MKKTRILSLLLVVVMLFAVCAGFTSCGAKNYAENNTKIKIGLTGPLTGAAAIYGTAVENAAQLAVEEINNAGGLNGIMFELVMLNDEHKAENVASRYAELYEGGMQVSLGTVTTAPGLEFKELSKDDNVFFITPSATGDGIPEYDNAFQMCFADSNQGAAAALQFNKDYAGKTIGVLYQSDLDYSTGIYNEFMKNIDASLKPSDANIKTFTEETSTNFTQQVEDLKDCDVIFMPIYYTPASTFMKQGATSISKDTIYYGCDGFDGIDAIEGFDIKTIPQEVSYLSHFNSNAQDGPAKEFIDKYNDKYDETKEPLNQFGAAAYDCVYAIYEAMKFAIAEGKEIPVNIAPSDLCEILKEVFKNDKFEIRGITGKCEGNEKSHISWNDNGTVSKDAIKYIVKEKNAG